MKRKIFSLLFFLYAIHFLAFSQQKYTETVKAYSTAFPYEKIFIHTDKPHYFPGDTIWFKAYVTTPEEGATNAMTPSVPLYVELIKPSVVPIASRVIIKLKKGKGSGDIALPKDFKPGVYKLRAYTAHGLNFGNEAIYEKEITIAEFGKRGNLKPANNDIQLFFIPEGGKALTGHVSKFAIRAMDSHGIGLSVKGLLLNSKNDTLHRFTIDQNGLKAIEFVPDVKEEYVLIAYNPSGQSKRFKFNNIAEESGYMLEVDSFSDEDQVLIKITRSGVNDQKPPQLYLLNNGFVQKEFPLIFVQNSAQFQISKTDMFPGVNVFKLVKGDEEPIAERLVYLADNEGPEVRIATSGNTFFPKDNVELQVSLKDYLGNPLQGEFSISVIDTKQVIPILQPKDIRSYMHLDSEVKEKTRNNSFLQDQRSLDIFLMTQQYRSYLPDLDILAREKPPHVFETGLNISGSVGNGSKTGEKDLRLLLMDKNGYPEISHGHTDQEGNFIFLGMDFTDTVGVYVQAFEKKARKNKKEKELQSGDIFLHLMEIPQVEPQTKIDEIVWLDVLEDQYLRKVYEVNEMLRKSFLLSDYELDELVVSGRRVDRQDPRTIAYNDNPDVRFRIPEGGENYYNVFDLLRAKLARRGIDFSPQHNYYVDGNLSTYQLVANMNVTDIEHVDMLWGIRPHQMNIGGRSSYNILTKKGNPFFDWSSVDIAGAKGFRLQGYAPVRNFFIPPATQDINSPIAIDYRSTVYWNPSVLSDNNGLANISFQLTEGVTTVLVEVQGITENGLPIYANMEFDVKDRN